MVSSTTRPEPACDFVSTKASLYDRAPHVRIAYIVTDDLTLRAQLETSARRCNVPTRWFSSSTAFLDFKRPHVPSCLLFDGRVTEASGADPGEERVIGNAFPPTIVLSEQADIPSCVRAIKAGAHDYLTLPVSSERLAGAMYAALRSDAADLTTRRERETLRKRWQSLTCREAEVVRYIVAGLLNKQTASELGITENTVQVHRGRAMRKMHAESFADLVRMSLSLAELGESSLLGTEHRAQKAVSGMPSLGERMVLAIAI